LSEQRYSAQEWDKLATNGKNPLDIQLAMLSNLVSMRKNLAFITFVVALQFFAAILVSVLIVASK
jgi:hypothetical protein